MGAGEGEIGCEAAALLQFGPVQVSMAAARQRKREFRGPPRSQGPQLGKIGGNWKSLIRKGEDRGKKEEKTAENGGGGFARLAAALWTARADSR